jgi:regulation of enolase protein 1 (concanavalin A-like superfamily)
MTHGSNLHLPDRLRASLAPLVAFVLLASVADARGQSIGPPWQNRDIGAVGTPGNAYADFDRGVWYVNGAGEDIWGTRDAFHFVFRELHGDGVIEATVTAIRDTHFFAKAGLMIRESLAENSKHALVNVRPNGFWEQLTRAETGGFTVVSDGTGAGTPRRLRLVRKGEQIEAFISFGPYSPGYDYSWTSVGVVSLPMPHTVYVGLAVTSHDPSTLNTGTFESVGVVSPGLVGPLPAPWTTQGIGETDRTGSAAYDRELNTFAIGGSGADIWGTADGFRYVSQPFAGDGEIVARLRSPSDFGWEVASEHPYAKAGLMLRETLTPSSAHVILDVRPTGDIEFMTRSATGQTTSFIAGGRFPYQGFLRLVRAGTTVTGSVSRDGEAWTVIGSVTTTISNSAYIGMAVTSHDATAVRTSWFRGVAVVQAEQRSTSEIVLYASDTLSSNRHGAWGLTNNPDSPDGLTLGMGNDGLAALEAPLASPTHYVDLEFDATAGTLYTLWLRLYPVSDSKWNDSVWVQFSDALVNDAPAYEMNTNGGLLVNLATDSTAASLHRWGWANGAYWLAQPATVSFSTTGPHTIRIQLREDGVGLDQIVLSSGRYRDARPGRVTDDHTIVTKE